MEPENMELFADIERMKSVPDKNSRTRNRADIIANVQDFVCNHESALTEYYGKVRLDKHHAIDNHIYQEIDRETYNNMLPKVSIVILSANFFECEILNFYAAKETPKKKIAKLRGGISLFEKNFRVVDAYLFELNGYTILHLHAPETGSHTPCGSSDLIRYVGNCDYLAPSCFISFGICYGIDCINNNLGDTIVANKIYPWSVGIKISEHEWHIKHDDYVIDLREGAPSLFHKIDEVLQGQTNNCPDKKITCNVLAGNMLTSEAVVSSTRVRKEAIKNAHGWGIVGGEMEGYGLAKECLYYQHIPCIILKAICDWGAVKQIDKEINIGNQALKNDCKGRIQAYAAHCAYEVFQKLLYEGVFPQGSFCRKLVLHFNKTHRIDCALLERDLRSTVLDFLIEEKVNRIDDSAVDFCINQLMKIKFLRERDFEDVKTYQIIKKRK